MGTREFGREPLAIDMTKLQGYGEKGGVVGAGLRVSVLDDSAAQAASDYPWTDDADPHDTPGSRRYWIEQYQEQLEVTQALRSDLSGARFERDIWWPLAFCVGVLCGLGFQWFA